MRGHRVHWKGQREPQGVPLSPHPPPCARLQADAGRPRGVCTAGGAELSESQKPLQGRRWGCSQVPVLNRSLWLERRASPGLQVYCLCQERSRCHLVKGLRAWLWNRTSGGYSWLHHMQAV